MQAGTFTFTPLLRSPESAWRGQNDTPVRALGAREFEFHIVARKSLAKSQISNMYSFSIRAVEDKQTLAE